MIKRYVDIDTGREFNRHEVEYPEPRRARRIRDKQRMKWRARHAFARMVDGKPYGRWQAFLKASERLADILAHCSKCSKPCCNKHAKLALDQPLELCDSG